MGGKTWKKGKKIGEKCFLLRKTTFEGEYLLYENNYMIKAF